MKQFRVPVTTKLLGCLLAATLSCAALAQNTGVVESRGIIPGQDNSQSGNQNRAGSNNDALTLLLDQNRQLREELQALRGMLEEQGFELRRLQRDSLNRYTNMDERLSALESAAVAAPANGNNRGNNTAAANRNQPDIDAASARVATAPVGTGNADSPRANNNVRSNNRTDRPASRANGNLEPVVLSEQQLYQMAYDSVINSNFRQSIAEFDQYLSVYPEGRFVSNAHYWKGQAYLYLNRFEDARESYEIILDRFGDSAKLPDAMYGLALAYQGLGNVSQARQLLNQIMRRFPNTGVANLANTRLLTLD